MGQRVKGFIDANVYEEAKRRMHHIYDLFDSVLVAFSGGKDSLVCVHLAREIALERGDDRPIKVVYRDPEFIHDDVTNFMEEYYHLDWIDMRWYCLPWDNNHTYILGTPTPYEQWRHGEEHARKMPEWAITNATLGLPPDYQVDMDDADILATRDEKGKVALVTGVRAAESLTRFRALTAKMNDNYINATKAGRVMVCKPIFDWQEDDVFRYFYEKGIRYCPVYDAQTWSGTQLRVSTPTHSESAKRIGQLRAYAPDVYERVLERFPDMAVQDRYYNQMNRDRLVLEYGNSLDDVERWIMDTVDDPKRRVKILAALNQCRKVAAVNPDAYPPEYVLKALMAGNYKRGVTALNTTLQARWKAKVANK